MNSLTSYIDYLSLLATTSLLMEAYLSPKAGLVDAYNVGSHKDMDIHTFKASSLSLQQGFRDYILIGYHHKSSLDTLLDEVRVRGVQSERDMFHATNNINTHKGANFSFALFLSAIGYQLQTKDTFSKEDLSDLQQTVKEIAKDLIQKDFKGIQDKDRNRLSNGEKLYVENGFAGIRQEAQDGYPNLFTHALRQLQNIRSVDIEYLYTYILVDLMSYVDDGNIIHRAGFKGLSYVKEYASKIKVQLNESNYKQLMKQMNDDFVAINISPGGSADLLALVIFIDLLTKTKEEVEQAITSLIGQADVDLAALLIKQL